MSYKPKEKGSHRNARRWMSRKVVLGSFFDTGRIDLSPFSCLYEDHQLAKQRQQKSLSDEKPLLSFDLSSSSKHDSDSIDELLVSIDNDDKEQDIISDDDRDDTIDEDIEVDDDDDGDSTTDSSELDETRNDNEIEDVFKQLQVSENEEDQVVSLDDNGDTDDHDDGDTDDHDEGDTLVLATATPPPIKHPIISPSPFSFAGGKDCPIINSPLIQYLSPAAKKETLSVRQKALALCNQETYLTMDEFFTPLMRKSLKKLGEGVFGEVYSAFTDDGDSLAIKIMPIDGKDKINDERQKTFEEILPEMVISKELSDLGHNMINTRYYTKNFVQLNKMSICSGRYPEFLLYAWDQYDEDGDSDNDRPDIFIDNQLFILFAFENSGHALESFVFHNQAEARSVIAQIAGTLAVGEGALGFEHRDMHRGNVLVKRTREEHITFIIDSVKYVIPSEGVKVTIIDYTLSRIQQGECISYNDLNNLPWLFEGKEGLQHQTYLHMKNFTGGDWSKFTPQTNSHWLHYAVNRMANKSKVKNLNRRHIYSALRPFLDKFTKCDSAKQVFLQYFSKPIFKKKN